MSLSPAQLNYARTLTLIDRTNATPTPIGEGIILAVSNNLDEYFLKAEIVNTGNLLTDNGRITLRIDAVGTFIRTAPILVDENAKKKYLLDFQMAQGSDKTKQFRFEISQAIIQEDENFGEVLVITVRGREYIMKENLSGKQLFFRTPKEAFDDRITEHAGNPSGNAQAGVVTNNLPDDESLRQNWLPTGPRPIHDLIQEILDRTALPGPSGGVLRDFYWDADADATATDFFDVIAEEYGRLPLSDGDRVEINPEQFGSAEQKDKTVITDSLVFKNHVILRGNSSKGSLPMDYVKFASNFEHARRRPDWDPASVSYQQDALVKREISSVVAGQANLVRFFRAKSSHTSSGANSPETTPSLWSEDFTIYPEFKQNGSYEKGHIVTETDGPNITYFQCNTAEAAAHAFTLTVTFPSLNPNFTTFGNAFPVADFTTFVSPNPWTNDADLWISNMTEGAPSGYRGQFVDWNFIRANYDRDDFNDEFEPISHKWVTRESNTPPTGAELFNGQRILVGTAPAGSFGSFAAGSVAQLDKAVIPITWRESRAPTADDIITDMSNGKIRRYDGASWTNGWTVIANNNKTSPIHLVKEIRYIAGPGGEGVPNQGIEFTFDWRLPPELGGDFFNRTSLGAWINFWFPFPRLASGILRTPSIGEAYGGTSSPLGTMDSTNLDKSPITGILGWNRGIGAEDMGRISGLAMKLKLRLEDQFGNKITQGYANNPFVFFAVDLFDRVYFHEFTLRRNDGWEDVVIPFGTRAPRRLYKNRIDEVIDIEGWNPFGNFFFAEREYTGVVFDWRFVKMWGIQWKVNYDGANRYSNSRVESGLNLAATAGQYILDSLTLGGVGAPLKFDVDFAKLAISDLRFIKELYVTSDDTEVPDGRTEIIHRESEGDYQTAKLASQGHRERTKFFPQTLHLRSYGDVRLRVGHRFIVTGDKVPGGTQEMVVQRVKHIIDATSYKMEIEAKRKFVIP